MVQNEAEVHELKKAKVAHTRLPSIEFRSWSWFLAVSLQVTWVINLFHYTFKKAALSQLPSVEFRSWSWFLAVSLQVTWVINPAVGCHYFPPGLQLPSQPLRGLLPVLLLGEQRHDGCDQFPKTVTRQCRSCDLNPGPSAPESSTLTTRLPSHSLQIKVTLSANPDIGPSPYWYAWSAVIVTVYLLYPVTIEFSESSC